MLKFYHDLDARFSKFMTNFSNNLRRHNPFAALE